MAILDLGNEETKITVKDAAIYFVILIAILIVILLYDLVYKKIKAIALHNKNDIIVK